MQVFGNVGTTPERLISKTSQKAYYQFRLSENKKGAESCWYTVRIFKDLDPGLERGAFCKVTGTLRVDCFVNRQGKPAAALLILAFEAVKLKSASELLESKLLAAAKEAVAA